MKHLFMLSDAKAKGATPPVCRATMPVERTALPRLVDCPACLDWIARNYQRVIEQVEALRRAA